MSGDASVTIVERHRWVEGAARLRVAKGSWAVLGADAELDLQLRHVAGANCRVALGPLVNNVAERLKQPYLDFLNEVGRSQVDTLLWFAGHFPSSSPLQDDAFLLLCQKALVERIVRGEESVGDPMFLFTSDPWLFAALCEEYQGDSGVAFVGRPGRSALTLQKATWLLRGVAGRLRLLAFLVVVYVVLRITRGRAPPRGAKSSGPRAGIVSYAEGRCFRDRHFDDPYLGALDQLLETHSVNVIRIWHLTHRLDARAIVGIVASRRRSWPVILELRLADLAAVLRIWRIDQPHEYERRYIGEVKFGLLLRRTPWAEFAHAGAARLIILHALLRRFFTRGWCDAVIYPFENQPWEKVMCMAGREAGGVRLVGCQHSTVPRLLLNYFLPSYDTEWLPLPHRIVTSGRYWTDVLVEAGYGTERIGLGGSLRYAHALGPDPWASAEHVGGGARRVLVMLPVQRAAAAELLSAIGAALRDCGEWLPPAEARIRPHPLTRRTAWVRRAQAIDGVGVSVGELLPALLSAHLVVCQGTSGGVEALLLGRPVLRIIPSSGLDVDPLRGVHLPGLTECTAQNVSAAVREALDVGGQATCGSGAHRVRAMGLVAPLDPAVWLEAAGVGEP